MILPTLLTALVLAAGAPTASAPVHGEGVLTADRGTMAGGESLKLTGASFEPNETFELKLVGVLQEFTLATIKTRPDSTFVLTVMIPPEAREGSYRLQVVAPDGDVSAALDVTLLAASPVPNERSTEPMPDMEHAAGTPMARADEVPIERSLSGAGWAVIGALIGLSAGLGIGLLRRGAAQE